MTTTVVWSVTLRRSSIACSCILNWGDWALNGFRRAPCACTEKLPKKTSAVGFGISVSPSESLPESGPPGQIPRGIWAVASGLLDRRQALQWAANASPAQAWTFRRPAGSTRQAVAALQALRHFPKAPAFLSVHGRFDWARCAGADAVITGMGSLPCRHWRTLWPEAWLAASAHDQGEIDAALAAGAQFLIFGPVWDTPSKRGLLAPRGLESLKRWCCRLPVPVLAIGGIQNETQVQACYDAGAHGVLVLRAAEHKTQLESLVQAWHRAAG
ncbi:MAG: thiamine phosphate synthase [Planctomycetota bacterium]|nr:MAG: thiamine phosphate synthase [Planctomycetota bacterium]